MTIKEVKEEVYYYRGQRIDDDLAFEILDYIKSNPKASICEVISGYFEI